MDRLLARLTEKIEMVSISNEKMSVTTDHTDIKKVMRDYQQLYSRKFATLDEMDQFFENHKLPHSLLWNNMNSQKTIKEIEFIIYELPKKKSPRPSWFHWEFYQKFK